LYSRLNRRNDVEKLTVEVMNQLMFKLAQNEIDEQKLHGLIWTLAHRRLIDFWRKNARKPQPISLESMTDFEAKNATDEFESKAFAQRIELLKKCIQATLPATESELVFAWILQEKTSAELGTELNQKPATIRKKLSRALNKIRTACCSIWKNDIA